MALTKKAFIAGTAAAALAAVMSGTALAATSGGQEDTLADKIAQKFNLKKEDVQSVIQEDRQQHQAEHRQRLTERLTQAVADKKITEQQKSDILAKLQEMDTFRDTLKDKSAEERRAAMDQKRDELKTWFQQNNIPTDLIGPGPGGRGGMHGPGPDGQ